MAGLQATVYVRDSERKIYVNFDSQILTLLRESECMARMELDIPPSAQLLRSKQHMLKDNHDKLQVHLLGNNLQAFTLAKRCVGKGGKRYSIS